MDLVISHMSALDFWRCVYPVTKAPAIEDALPCYEFGEMAVMSEDVWSYAPSWVTNRFLEVENGVLHTLVPSRSYKRKSKTHFAHFCKGPIPPNALYSFGNGVFVCSPAFAYLQMARTLSKEQLTFLACELSGRYAFDLHSERGFRMREMPLVTLDDLEEFLQDSHDTRGACKAQAALKFAVGDSASPMETACALLMSLPVRQGGYALPKPEMNREIELTGKARAIHYGNRCFGDLCWPNDGLVVEYLGEYDHQGALAMQSDRGRTNALSEMGFEVVELSSPQVFSQAAFEAIVLRLADRLGKRIRLDDRGQRDSRKSLRDDVFAWNRAYGHPCQLPKQEEQGFPQPPHGRPQ